MKFRLGSALALVAALMVSEVPQIEAANDISRLVPFQGRLHGSNNTPVTDGTYDITFYIYDTPTGGTALWSETHPKVSVIHGYVNVLLGAINPLDNEDYQTGSPKYDKSNTLVDFTTQKFLGISVEGGAEMFPRSQLVPSFHAFTANHAAHAKQADNADNLGGKAASTYAQVSFVNTQDTNLDNRITALANGTDTKVGTVNSRLSTLESKFTGTKSKDADKLDGKNSDYFVRKNGSDVAPNSDKLDGLNSTDFLRNNGKAVDADKWDGIESAKMLPATAYEIPASQNLNSYTAPGFYYQTANADATNGTNYPSAIAGSLVVQHAAGTTQQYYGYSANSMYYRGYYSNTWSPWAKVWSDKNDGAGSGLDADKLDGLSQESFMRSSRTNDLVPVGTVLMWPSTAKIPSGYLQCDGALISQSTYADLYAILGSRYGVNGGSFYLPDYRGVFVRGWDNGAGRDIDKGLRTKLNGRGYAGDTVGSYQVDEVVSHTHPLIEARQKLSGKSDYSEPGSPLTGEAEANGSVERTSHIKSFGGSETRPKNVTVMFIIKAKNH